MTVDGACVVIKAVFLSCQLYQSPRAPLCLPIKLTYSLPGARWTRVTSVIQRELAVVYFMSSERVKLRSCNLTHRLIVVTN